MISILNYGLGNIQAIANIYKRLNLPAEVVSSAEEVRSAERIILPGVGAFDWAMARLNKSGVRGVLEEVVVGDGRPVLGICVGMQMMATRSEEGSSPGLGWIDAEVRKFDWAEETERTWLPHMGWNDVEPCTVDGLFRGFNGGSRFYFLHSYYFAPQLPENILAVTDYRGPFASAVRAGNIRGVQFHPEKSHRWGIQLLKNFAEM